MKEEKSIEETYDSECKHEPCGCLVAEYGDFCSDWCERAIETTDCGCGHIDCRAIA